MNCQWISIAIPLYFYGELPPEAEEQLEEHLAGCDSCRREMERQRTLAAALDEREMAVPDELLAQCRQDLMGAVGRNQSPAGSATEAPAWQSLRQAWSSLVAGLWGLRQPIGAVALVALGYFAAQIAGSAPRSGRPEGGLDPVVARVRSVQPDTLGGVRIALDETRPRVVSGRLDDSNIQRLLMTAARDENNAAIRVESMDLLKDHAGSADVRAALLNAVANDQNPGVRLKALEGLKSFVSDAQVRKTLAQVLLKDENPGVRIHAIDMLTASRDGSTVGVLQNLVERENNSYVRLRCEKALQDMNASIGTF
jgi:hypothetical protein